LSGYAGTCGGHGGGIEDDIGGCLRWILILRRRYRPRAVAVFELPFINNYGIGADEMTVA
jgi:hypothetical protein